jgi:Fe2+ or Zn2+ uptake regulation protein
MMMAQQVVAPEVALEVVLDQHQLILAQALPTNLSQEQSTISASSVYRKTNGRSTS